MTLSPSCPSPLLDEAQTQALIQRGHLPLQLSPELEGLYTSLFECMTTFFDKQSEEKQQVYIPTHGTEQGYYSLEGEKEYITFRHSIHSSSQLEDLVGKVWKDTALLLHRVLISISVVLNLPMEAWDPLLDGSLDLGPGVHDSSPSLLRLFNYLPNAGTAGSHTDNGLLTLCVGSGRGLQVRNCQTKGCQKCWTDAEGPTLLVGSTLKAILQNRVNVGFHRVISNPLGRNSIVFALRPSVKHWIDLSPFGGDCKVDMEELFLGIKNSKSNVNSRSGTNDAEKKE